MNCEESKTLIVAMTEADEAGNNAGLSAHLAACSTCRQFLKYELKMRAGFAGIVSEPLPADVTRKILAVPGIVAAGPSTDAPGWFSKLSSFFRSMTFKIALASGITGFAAAIIFLRGFSPGFDRPQQPAQDEFKQVKSLERPLFDRDRSFSRPASATAITAAGAAVNVNPELKKMLESKSGLTDDLRSLKPEETFSIAAERKPAVSGRIPGAVSFSLDAGADADTGTDASGRFAMAPAEISSENAALAFSESEKTSIEPSARAKSETTASFADKETGFSTDPRAAAILSFLESNGLAVEEGFVDLDELFVKGYIDNSRLREWRAPDGNGWYLSRAGNRYGIVLRRKP